MSVDIGLIISNIILCLIASLLLYINISIYKETKGGSNAYKCWAIATIFIFINSFFVLISGFFTGSDELDSSNLNEIVKLITFSLASIGYFYIPLGALHLSNDMDIYHIDKKKIRKLELFWVIFILSYFIGAFSLLFEYYIAEFIRNFFDIIITTTWIFSIAVYYPFYNKIKNLGNDSWTYLFLGVICSFLSALSANIRDIGLDIFQYIKLVFDTLLGLFYILGFYKLAKMVEAI